MSVAALLVDSCTVRRKTSSVSASSGAPTTSWSNAATGVACAVQASSSSQSFSHAREVGTFSFNVFFEYGVDVRVGDRLSITTNAYSGRLLTVTSPPTDDAGRRAYTRVTAVEIDGGGEL